jgi:hypothetical protein
MGFGRGISMVCLLFTIIISLIFSRLGKNTVEGMAIKDESFPDELVGTPIDDNTKVDTTKITYSTTQPPVPESYNTTGVYNHLFSDTNSSDTFRILAP